MSDFNVTYDPATSSPMPAPNRPPAQPRVILGPGTSSVSAGSKPVTSQPTSTLGADASKGFAQAGQVLSQVPVEAVGPVRARPGNPGNKSGRDGDTHSGFPDAGAGPGTGLVTKPGIMGQTKTRHKGGALPPGFSGSR
jgi:hypothetical protein